MDLATKEDFESLKAQIENLTAYVMSLNSKIAVSDVMYVSDIARIEDLSISGIKKTPWLLPDFGQSEYPGGRTRWSTQKVLEWRAIPVKTRLTMWRTRTANQMEKYLGASNG